MKYTKYILSLMFLASLNGCIKEDMSDCPGNCLLEFSYVGDGTTQIFQDKIHKVDMYVFDSDGALLSSHPISEADIKTRATEIEAAYRKLPDCDSGQYLSYGGQQRAKSGNCPIL